MDKYNGSIIGVANNDPLFSPTADMKGIFDLRSQYTYNKIDKWAEPFGEPAYIDQNMQRTLNLTDFYSLQGFDQDAWSSFDISPNGTVATSIAKDKRSSNDLRSIFSRWNLSTPFDATTMVLYSTITSAAINPAVSYGWTYKAVYSKNSPYHQIRMSFYGSWTGSTYNWSANIFLFTYDTPYSVSTSPSTSSSLTTHTITYQFQRETVPPVGLIVPRHAEISPDGAYFWYLDSNNRMRGYELTTPFNISSSSASYIGFFDFEGSFYYYSPDNTIFITKSGTTYNIYTNSTPWTGLNWALSSTEEELVSGIPSLGRSEPIINTIGFSGEIANINTWSLEALRTPNNGTVYQLPDYTPFVPAPPSQLVFDSPALSPYSWTVPEGVTSISAVAVGGGGGGSTSTLSSNGFSGGGGGGGGLHWRTFDVVPGETLTINVGHGGAGGTSWGTNNATSGESSTIVRGSLALVEATGGARGSFNSATRAAGGEPSISLGGGGGAGGAGGGGSDGNTGGGGGGAGGYSGTGGAGSTGISYTSGTSGSGGGGSGSTGANNITSTIYWGGGGVGILGEGSSGIYNGTTYNYAGVPGSGGSGGLPIQYGGGGAGAEDDSGAGAAGGGQGAVRIIWGTGREYPSTNTGDV